VHIVLTRLLIIFCAKSDETFVANKSCHRGFISPHGCDQYIDPEVKLFIVHHQGVTYILLSDMTLVKSMRGDTFEVLSQSDSTSFRTSFRLDNPSLTLLFVHGCTQLLSVFREEVRFWNKFKRVRVMFNETSKDRSCLFLVAVMANSWHIVVDGFLTHYLSIVLLRIACKLPNHISFGILEVDFLVPFLSYDGLQQVQFMSGITHVN
jgi:hypothetical protein